MEMTSVTLHRVCGFLSCVEQATVFKRMQQCVERERGLRPIWVDYRNQSKFFILISYGGHMQLHVE